MCIRDSMDYCLYMAIKEAQGGAPWYAWPSALRDRDPAALAEVAAQLDARVLLLSLIHI